MSTKSDMKLFKFRAGTNKDEIILGLVFPASFMLPMLIMVLIIEWTFPRFNITQKLSVNLILEYMMLIPSFFIGALFMKKIEKYIVHDFEIHIKNEEIAIYQDGKQITSEELKYVKVKECVKSKEKILRYYRLDVFFEQNNFTFIARLKEKSNPFGMVEIDDIYSMRNLYEYLKNAYEY